MMLTFNYGQVNISDCMTCNAFIHYITIHSFSARSDLSFGLFGLFYYFLGFDTIIHKERQAGQDGLVVVIRTLKLKFV